MGTKYFVFEAALWIFAAVVTMSLSSIVVGESKVAALAGLTLSAVLIDKAIRLLRLRRAMSIFKSQLMR